MKAPEKIYIHRTIHFGLLSAAEINITGEDVEYVRKDKLLAWAQEKRADITKSLEAQDDPVLWGQRNAFQQTIDKINSL